MDKKGKESIVAEGTSFNGTVKSECPITVSGVVDGELNAPALVVSDSGHVHGKIKVDDLKSSGEISGNIEAGAIQLSGKVKDNTSIKAKTLEVKLDSGGSDKLQLTFGACTLEVGEEGKAKGAAPDVKPNNAAKPGPPDVKAPEKKDPLAKP